MTPEQAQALEAWRASRKVAEPAPKVMDANQSKALEEWRKSKPAETMSTTEDVARSSASGLITGATDALDMAQSVTPVGILQGAYNGAAKLANWVKPDLKVPESDLLPSTRKIADKVAPETTEYEPKTKTGAYFKTGASMLPGMIAPGGVIKNAITNVAIPALATETASQWVKGTPYEKYDPYIRAATGIASSIGSGTAFDAVENIWNPSKAAAKILATEATDPKKALAAIKRESLSPLNLAEASDDVGLAQMQKKMHAKSPKLQTDLKELEGAQNAARTDELSKLAPDSADTLSPSALLRQKAKEIEDQANDVVSKLTGAATPDAIGSNIRTAINAVEREAKKKIKDLYKSVDNNTDLHVVSSPVRDAAKEIIKTRDKLSAPFTPDERRILSLGKELGETTPYKSLVELEGNLTDAIKASKTIDGAPTRATSRLTHLKEKVRSSIDNAIDNQSSWTRPAGNLDPAPNMTKMAADDLRKAQAAHAEYAKTFKTGPVKKIVANEGYKDQFKMSDSNIAATALPTGDKGYDAVKSILKADPKSVQSLKDAAIMRLQNKDGKVTPEGLKKWKNDYGHSLRAIDEAAPGFSASFDNIADASAQINTNAAQKLLNAESADQVRSEVGSMLTAKDGAKQLSEIVSHVGKDQSALDGLRLAGVKSMQQELSNAGTSGGEQILSGAKMGKFVSKNSDALKTLYGPEGFDRIQRIADDLKRTQNALSNQKIGTGSDTASMLTKLLSENAEKAGDLSLMSLFAGTSVNAIGNVMGSTDGSLATLTSASLPLFGAMGAQVIRSMRRAGIKNVNDLVEKAILDPKLAESLLDKGMSKWGKLDNEKVQNLIRVLNATNASGVTAKAYGGAVGYKSGGRVNKHIAIANRLVMMAERAKKGLGKSTEPLLNTPDDMIAKALEVANRGI